MPTDLNLLITLDILLTQESVTRAARKLGLSHSAMSRALSRLRKSLGDPLLVRAGRKLVPTPRALALRSEVSRIALEAQSILQPAQTPDLRQIHRTFTLRAREGFVETFGPAILRLASRQAPGIQLRFIQKPNKDSAPLRESEVDLEIGVIAKTTSPELVSRPLFKDRFVVVTRAGHPLTRSKLTPARYAAALHIATSRTGNPAGPIDDALASLKLSRQIPAIVSDFSQSLALARSTDLIATVPEKFTSSLRAQMRTLPLPFDTPPITISMLWHPRLDADPAHRWLRQTILAACTKPQSRPRKSPRA